MSASPDLLTGTDLGLSFGPTRALSAASLTVARSEVVAVMGPSGSGKSTLLHCLAGILRPDAGEVWFEGARLDTASERERSAIRLHRFGFVFQFGELIPELTLRENIRLPLQLTKAPGSADERVDELLDALEINDVAGRRAAEASGGQAQRAAVARALAHRPGIVFADEPTGALDSVTAELVLTTLVRLAREQGAGVVLVTHDHRVAAHADREVVLRDGRNVTPEVVG